MRPSVVLVALAAAPLLMGADAAPDDPVVARAGAVEVHASEVQRRLAELAPFQIESLGPSRAEAARRLLEEVLVPDALLVAGAEATGAAAREPTAYLLRRARSNAALRAARREVPPPQAIAPEDVQAYFEAHRERWEQPERVGVWRILVGARAEAEEVLAEARKDGTPATWVRLARDRSLDKATYLRGGNLGFLAPDGASSEGFKADAAVVAAARGVKDGQIVPRVVEEPGAGFAVVWRRGTLAGVRRPLPEAAPEIREILYRKRIEDAQAKLLADLRARDVHDLREDLVAKIDVFSEYLPGRAPPTAPSASASRR